jgi:hypothetical protein
MVRGVSLADTSRRPQRPSPTPHGLDQIDDSQTSDRRDHESTFHIGESGARAPKGYGGNCRPATLPLDHALGLAAPRLRRFPLAWRPSRLLQRPAKRTDETLNQIAADRRRRLVGRSAWNRRRSRDAAPRDAAKVPVLGPGRLLESATIRSRAAPGAAWRSDGNPRGADQGSSRGPSSANTAW